MKDHPLARPTPFRGASPAPSERPPDPPSSALPRGSLQDVGHLPEAGSAGADDGAPAAASFAPRTAPELRGTDLAGLVASRICHDLTSPLGAIGNGVELLELSTRTTGPEMELIVQSVGLAKARLRLLRLAFGAAPLTQTVGRAEIAHAVADLQSVGRLAVEWQPPGSAERGIVKLVLLLLQCLESAMPVGGTAAVATQADHWRISGHAARLRPLPDHWAALAGHAAPAEATAPLLHFPLAAETARALGRLLTVNVEDSRITIAF